MLAAPLTAPGGAVHAAATSGWLPQLSATFGHATAAHNPSAWGLQMPQYAAPMPGVGCAAAAAAAARYPLPGGAQPAHSLPAQLPAQLQQRLQYAQAATAAPRRRRGCTRCVCCTPSATLARRSHSGRLPSSSDRYASEEEAWPGGLPSPSLYFALRRKQMSAAIKAAVRSPALWRPVTVTRSAPAELRDRRGVRPLCVLVPQAYTNIQPAERVELVGVVDRRLSLLPPPPSHQPSSLPAGFVPCGPHAAAPGSPAALAPAAAFVPSGGAKRLRPSPPPEPALPSACQGIRMLPTPPSASTLSASSDSTMVDVDVAHLTAPLEAAPQHLHAGLQSPAATRLARMQSLPPRTLYTRMQPRALAVQPVAAPCADAGSPLPALLGRIVRLFQ